MAKNPSFDDLFKVSPALAVANTLLGDNSPWRQPEEEPSLADQFIAATHTLGSRYKGRHRKLIDDVMLRYRIDMRKAHRFVLDDDFVEMACYMANVQPAKILARLQYASLPYENTWIELDLHTKVRTLRKIHGLNLNDQMDQVSQRLGFLLQRISDTEAVCTLVSDAAGDASPHVICYFFSLREYDFLGDNKPMFGCHPVGLVENEDDITGIVLKRVPSNSLNDNVGKASLWGYTGQGTANADIIDMRTPQFLMRHGDIGFSRMFESYYHIFTDKDAIDKLNKLIVAEMREFIGNMRWVVTVLAMLNQVPVHADHVVREHQMRIGHLKKHQFVDYHKVTLRLPKTNPIPYIEKHLRGPSERRHRAHEVRAHWRTYLHAEHCGPDEHDWVYDYDDGYRLCGKCDAYGRLIHEHVRGNQELGWVRKDYVLKPAVKL